LRPEDAPDAEPDVLVLTTLGAPRAGSRLRRGRVRPAGGGDQPPTPLALTRATFVRPRPFTTATEADAWLEEVCSGREVWHGLAREAAGQLNRLIHAHRTAAGDPFLADVDPSRAAAIRFGYGTGEEVADGRWTRANELPDDEARKLIDRDYEALRPQERVAAVLGGRETIGPHEELIVRARGDLDAGRTATAALGLSAGLDALVAREGDDESLLAARRVAIRSRDEVMSGGTPEREPLDTALRAAEAAIRKRALG
jgi:hypothetical protein